MWVLCPDPLGSPCGFWAPISQLLCALFLMSEPANCFGGCMWAPGVALSQHRDRLASRNLALLGQPWLPHLQ